MLDKDATADLIADSVEPARESGPAPEQAVRHAGVRSPPSLAGSRALAAAMGNAAFTQAILLRQHDAPPAAELYTVTLSDGEHANLAKDDALKVLTGAMHTLQRAFDMDSGEWAEVNKARLSFFGAIGGALTDLAGKDMPSYEETWAQPFNKLVAARKELRAGNVKAAGDELRAAHAAYDAGRVKWYAYKAQLEDAGTRAQVGVAVVAVVAVAVIATGGAVAGALAPAAGTGGAAGAGAGGGAVVGGGAGGAGALAATAPVDAAAAGTATTVVGGGGGAVVGGGAGAGGSAAALGTTQAAGAAGAAGGSGGAGAALGATTVAGVGGATADAIAGAAIADTTAAMQAGGTAAATATAEGMSIGVLEAAFARLTTILVANAPLVSAEAQMLKRVQDVILEVYKRKGGIPSMP